MPAARRGLAGSRRLIEQMGGSLSVEDELGAGSTFTLWLPLSPRAAHATQDTKPEA